MQRATTSSSPTTSSPADVCSSHATSLTTDKIIKLLGQGTFGKVVEAKDITTRRKVAIKIIRAVQKYRDASKIEIRVLETLRKHDPANVQCVV